MSDKFNDLVRLLRELFQLDQPDLDFGLYRIMHAKSGEVTQFLEKDLLPQVKKAFEQYQPADKAAIKKKLDQAVAAAESLGVNPDTNEKVLQLRAELAEGADLEAMESEVYDHLYSFFRRYYSEGDFLAKRVYKPGVYAVPYEGEEVVLHWANKDQYYIKTSEYLRDYAFRLKPDAGDAGGDPMRVHFRLVVVAEGEHGNNKAAEGKDRVFILAPAGESGHDFLSVETVDGQEELVIGFEYRPATMDDWTDEAKAQATAAAKKKPPKQKDLIDIAVKAVLATTGDPFDGWIAELAKQHTKVNGETAVYSRLEGHLSRYCARHTFDYFIHKNLGGFLRRELDFYIKNEVMHLDDVQNEDAPKVEQYLSKIKVIRKIAGKVIDFLHQLEEFQRKLWLKKKFVTETFYCIRVGVIPEEFYAEIAANQAQHDEWVELCAINKIKGDLTTTGYSQKLKVEFLKAQPTLMVDTRHFPQDFVARLLDAIGDLEDVTDGIMMHSENFQAIRLLSGESYGRADCIYLDPPYNAQSSEIVYKNSYRHSSWLSLMANRLECGRSLESGIAVTVIAIDEVEQEYLGCMLDHLYPDQSKTCVTVVHNATGQQGNNFSATHEYAYFLYPPKGQSIGLQDRADNPDVRPLRNVSKGAHLRIDAANCFYPIYVKDGQITGFGDVCPDEFHPSGVNVVRRDGVVEVYPIDASGEERKWVFARQSVESILGELQAKQDAATGIWDIIRTKTRFNFKTVWMDSKYSANSWGSRILNDVLGENQFTFPKSVNTVRDCVDAALGNRREGVVLDYFAGSGTTGHAVIEMNRMDGGRRRFILAEMGAYFDDVPIKRMKKVSYAPEWRGGKPHRLCTAEEADRSPRIIKIVRVESYDDTLNNLVIARKEPAQALLSTGNAKGLAEEYVLRYMLEVETRGSGSLLDVSAFVDPQAYRIWVKAPGSDENRSTPVDLIETFNWLLGLRVTSIGLPKTFKANFARDAEGRLDVMGRIKEDPDGPWWFRTVNGTTPDGKRALIIWRKRPGGDEPEGIEQDNAALDAWFRTQGYSTTDSEFDIVWVNGDNNLANLRQDETPDDGLGETGWKVRIIEQDFHRLMFDTSDVPGGA